MAFPRLSTRAAAGALGLLLLGPALSLSAGDDGKKTSPAREAWREEFQRGVVLGMHSKERGFDYGPAVAEIAALGASWISLGITALLDGIEATTIDRSSPRTPSDADLVATIRKAKAKGLRVLLFPIVLIRDPGPDDWRGALRPKDTEEWFRSYREFILHYAGIAKREGADALSIGSEYCTLERRTEGWRGVIRAVRSVFPGLLTYSANWDHYDVPEFWDDLDFVGMSSYHRLSNSKEPALSELVESWRKVRDRVVEWAKETGKRVVFTEVGYPSLDDCNEYPWNYLLKNPVDLKEQADCYRAFATVWKKEPMLQGVYFYEWWGEGGAEDRSYTPRGKPAEAVLREYFKKAVEDAASTDPPR